MNPAYLTKLTDAALRAEYRDGISWVAFYDQAKDRGNPCYERIQTKLRNIERILRSRNPHTKMPRS